MQYKTTMHLVIKTSPGHLITFISFEAFDVHHRYNWALCSLFCILNDDLYVFT